MDANDTAARRYKEESDNWLECLTNDERKRVAESWFRTDTVDAWRHNRMYACIDLLLEAYPSSQWLTVGDGRFGKDAHHIQQKGHRVLATDISDTLLKIGAQKNYIGEFKAENAESLSFPNGSFDFVFCKESYHHFPRPMVALYEMLRVAREGIVLIEPNEAPCIGSLKLIVWRLVKWMLLRCGFASVLRTRDTSLLQACSNSWEEVGNYVYTVSERELEKVAFAMAYPACAFKGLNDYYEKGVEFEKATDDSPLFQKVQQRITRADHLCRMGLSRYAPGLLVAVIFKQPVALDVIRVLEESGFAVKELPKGR